MTPNPARKHHHVPEFYTKQWCGADRKLCEYKRPYRNVVARRKFPSQTGFRNDLYTVNPAPPQAAAFLEDRFLRLVDQRACDALHYLLSGRGDELPGELRKAWAQFIIAMLQRSPEKIAWLRHHWDENFNVDTPQARQIYGQVRRPNDPETFAEYLTANGDRLRGLGTIRMLQAVMELPRTGNHLVGMNWAICTCRNVSFDLLTSDRPVIMSNGLISPESHVIVPIAPDRIFVAANRREFVQGLEDMPPKKLISACNNIVAGQAHTLVFGVDDTQIRFVENRLGRRPAQLITSKSKG